MDVDPAALGELVEQRAVEAARGAIVDILDGSLMSQSGVAQAREKPSVAAVSDLAIEQQAKVVQRCGFAGCFDLAEGFSSETVECLWLPLDRT